MSPEGVIRHTLPYRPAATRVVMYPSEAAIPIMSDAARAKSLLVVKGAFQALPRTSMSFGPVSAELVLPVDGQPEAEGVPG